MVDVFPTLPSLGADETLAFFTHKTLRRSVTGIEVFYGDHEGLEHIGSDMLRSSLYEAFVRDHEDLEFSVDAIKVCHHHPVIIS